eukprot:scaffold34616_cov275-Amphora_coffeaeformis.AAC.3
MATTTTTFNQAATAAVPLLHLSTESTSLVLLLVSALLYSIMGVFLQLTHLPPTQLVCIRATFQGTLVVISMCCTKTTTTTTTTTTSTGASQSPLRLIWCPLGDSWHVQRVVILRGLVGGLGFVFYYYTLTALPLGDAIALSSLKSVIAIGLGYLVLGEPIHFLHGAVALASVTGGLLIARPTFLFGPQQHNQDNADTDADNLGRTTITNINRLGYITALLGACTAASVLILIRKAGSVGAHTLQLLFSWAAFGLILSLLCRPLDEPWQMPINSTSNSDDSNHTLIYVLAMCSIGSVGHFLLNYAGKLAPAGPASIMRSSDMAFAYVWQVLVFHQQPTLITMVGVAFISVATLTLAITKVRNERSQQHPETAAHADGMEMSRLTNQKTMYQKVASSRSTLDMTEVDEEDEKDLSDGEGENGDLA